MIIDINNKLLDGMVVDTFNTLEKEVKLSFEERIVIDKEIDIGLFKNIESIKLNDVMVKTNITSLTEILNNSNQETLSVNLEGTNPIANQIFKLVMDDIKSIKTINIITNSEMEENSIKENIAFLSSKTKNNNMQEEENKSFLDAVDIVVDGLKSNLLDDRSYEFSYNEVNTSFSLSDEIGDGLSLLSTLGGFLSNSFSIQTLHTLTCYSNCHCNCYANCHGNCHGSRGWR